MGRSTSVGAAKAKWMLTASTISPIVTQLTDQIYSSEILDTGTYLITGLQHEAKGECMCQSKRCKHAENKSAHARTVVEGCIVEYAATTHSFGLLSEALQTENEQAVCVVHEI